MRINVIEMVTQRDPENEARMQKERRCLTSLNAEQDNLAFNYTQWAPHLELYDPDAYRRQYWFVKDPEYVRLTNDQKNKWLRLRLKHFPNKQRVPDSRIYAMVYAEQTGEIQWNGNKPWLISSIK